MPGGIHPPADVVLSWPAPNYINPITRPSTIPVLASIFGPITVIMLLARLWVRVFIQRAAGWDDWLMLIATVPATALTVMLPISAHRVFDRHVWDTDVLRYPEKIVESRKYVLAIMCLFCATSGLIKISILLFYRRLSARVVSRGFRWTTWLSIGFIATYTIALTLAPIFGCNPISSFWNQSSPTWLKEGHEFHCFDEGADMVVAGILSVIQDFITAVLPSFLYWNLRIPLREKIPLIGIFALGYSVVALGSLRVHSLWRIYYDTYDVAWETWRLFTVTLLELHAGAFCANVPAAKALFRHLTQDNKVTTGSGSSALEKGSYLNSKDHSSHVKAGYIPDSHAGYSIDSGTQVQRGTPVDRSRPPTISTTSICESPRNSTSSTDKIYGRGQADIELSQYNSSKNPRASVLSLDMAGEDDLDIRSPLPTSLATTVESTSHAKPHWQTWS